MPHWSHTETPFGSIVYATSNRGDVPSITLHGAGELDAAAALTTDHNGDSVPNWDAMKAEAKRQAEEAGAPLASWYTPNPSLTINGKSYSDTVWGELRTDVDGIDWVYFRNGGLTDAARRKLGAWILENRTALFDGENGRASAIASARDALRWAEMAVTEAEEAAYKARTERDAAQAKLDELTEG
ncbi:hypothetical protein MRBLMI12_000458 [Microbacterium sp. LMI12-1-1.1]|uniref:hypothetical protein n=1 Tax=Microbacterium sp. LMI12-1-1.1 TaxID=3135225 RepID=UPI00341C45CA